MGLTWAWAGAVAAGLGLACAGGAVGAFDWVIGVVFAMGAGAAESVAPGLDASCACWLCPDCEFELDASGSRPVIAATAVRLAITTATAAIASSGCSRLGERVGVGVAMMIL